MKITGNVDGAIFCQVINATKDIAQVLTKMVSY